MSSSIAAQDAAVNAQTAAYPYLSAHTADPGLTGANEVTGGAYARVAETFGTAANGMASNSASATLNVPASTTVTHIGHWTAATGGTFGFAGPLGTPQTFNTAGPLTLPIGADVVLAPASNTAPRPWDLPSARRYQDYIRQAAGPTGGATMTLLSLPGAGVVEWIDIITDGSYNAYDGVLKVYTDGKGTPDLAMDMGTLFGYQWGTHYIQPQHISCEHLYAYNGGNGTEGGVSAQGTMNYPMPYNNGIVITLTDSGQGHLPGGLWFNCSFTPATSAPTTKRLKSAGVIGAALPSCPTYHSADVIPLCSLTGSGLVVCQTITGHGATEMSWLERSMFVYVDGEGTPSLGSSGTEDWFGFAFYFTDPPQFNNWSMSPGCYQGGGPQYATGTIDLLAKDGGIPFSTSIAFNLTPNGGYRINTDATVASCTLYYS